MGAGNGSSLPSFPSVKSPNGSARWYVSVRSVTCKIRTEVLTANHANIRESDSGSSIEPRIALLGTDTPAIDP